MRPLSSPCILKLKRLFYTDEFLQAELWRFTSGSDNDWKRTGQRAPVWYKLGLKSVVFDDLRFYETKFSVFLLCEDIFLHKIVRKHYSMSRFLIKIYKSPIQNSTPNVLVKFLQTNWKNWTYFQPFTHNVITHSPVDTGRKLNVHKTFNLRPVSTGRILLITILCIFISAIQQVRHLGRWSE